MYSAEFYIALLIHLVSLIVGLGSVLVIDAFGVLWLTKRVTLVSVVKVANVTQELIWLGWFGLVFSGIPLILIKGSVDNLTLIKLFLVVLVGLNGLFLHHIKKRFQSIVRYHGTVSPRDEFHIGFATLISQVGWWGAVIIGFAHRHIAHRMDWPENPWPYMITSIIVIITTFYAGETIFHGKHKFKA